MTNKWKCLYLRSSCHRTTEDTLYLIQQRWCINIKIHNVTWLFFPEPSLCMSSGGQWPLGIVLPLLVVLSEKQTSKSALHALGPRAAGWCWLAPQTFHSHLRQRSTAPHLSPALTPKTTNEQTTAQTQPTALDKPVCCISTKVILFSGLWRRLASSLHREGYCIDWLTHCELLVHNVLHFNMDKFSALGF